MLDATRIVVVLSMSRIVGRAPAASVTFLLTSTEVLVYPLLSKS